MAASFLSGVVLAGSLVAALFFLRFWRQSGDRLFAMFSLAFTALSIERLILVVVDESNETRPYVYLVRLLAFALIAAAVLDKNRASTPERVER